MRAPAAEKFKGTISREKILTFPALEVMGAPAADKFTGTIWRKNINFPRIKLKVKFVEAQINFVNSLKTP
jgi:hypothetical protein